MKFKSFDYWYIGIVLIDIFAIYTYPGLRMISKPLVMASLLGHYVQITEEQQKPLILTAMLFALIGDIFLLFDFPLFFQLGIAAFLVMQICYIIYFKKFTVMPQGKKLYYSLAVVAIAILFNLFFFDKLGDYKYHVIVYSIAICVMVLFGINQQLSNSIFIGSLFFLVSDFLLAYNKFINPHIVFGGLVMGTYAIAQYFIVKGVSVKVR